MSHWTPPSSRQPAHKKPKNEALEYWILGHVSVVGLVLLTICAMYYEGLFDGDRIEFQGMYGWVAFLFALPNCIFISYSALSSLYSLLLVIIYALKKKWSDLGTIIVCFLLGIGLVFVISIGVFFAQIIIIPALN